MHLLFPGGKIPFPPGKKRGHCARRTCLSRASIVCDLPEVPWGLKRPPEDPPPSPPPPPPPPTPACDLPSRPSSSPPPGPLAATAPPPPPSLVLMMYLSERRSNETRQNRRASILNNAAFQQGHSKEQNRHERHRKKPHVDKQLPPKSHRSWESCTKLTLRRPVDAGSSGGCTHTRSARVRGREEFHLANSLGNGQS